MSKSVEYSGANRLNVTEPQNEVRGSALPFFVVTGAFSVAVNLLMLVTPLYMLQIYDRVLTSGSMETLILVSIVAVGMLCAFGFAEAARRKTLALASDFVQARYGPAIFRSSFSDAEPSQALSKRLADLSTVQAYYQNGLSLPFFDLPFTPLFLLAMFLVHPLVGWVGIIGGVVLVLVTLLTELQSRGPVRKAQIAEQNTQAFADALGRHQATIKSHGMTEPLFRQWARLKSQASKLTVRGTSASGFFGAHARGLRLMLQVAALGIGAWLVLHQQVTAGAIVAGSILLGRALAPIDQALGAWRQIVKARQAWESLKAARKAESKAPLDFTPLPIPDASLSIEALRIAPPGSEQALLPKFNLQVNGGTVVVVVGSSGAGKSTLLQTLSGAWTPLDGVVRLGGRDLHRWVDADRGQYVGYAPQDIELLPGTIADNICRFTQAEPETVVSTAVRAGFHDMILKFPDGYDTVVGVGGAKLSRGQRQGVGLARALFGDPVLICLDEPSASLDDVSVDHLKRDLSSAKLRGAIVIVSTHDRRLLDLADQVLVIEGNSLKMLSGDDYRMHNLETGGRLSQSVKLK